MAVRIFVADDHEVVRLGLRSLLAGVPGWQVVGETGDGTQVVGAVERLQPDVLLLDLLLPGLGGHEIARQVRRRAHRTGIVVLSSLDGDDRVVEALRLGARGYVQKAADASEVVRAVEEVARGGRYLSPPHAGRAREIWERVVAEVPVDPYETLTPREREVLHLLLEGLTCPAIAARLCISSRTAESHRANVRRKLGVRTHADMLRLIARRGLLPPEGET